MTSDAVAATRALQVLVGKSLTQLCVGVADVQLRFDDGLGVQLEAGVEVGDSQLVDPFSSAGVTALLPLLKCVVAAAHVEASGGLVLTFGATSLRCAADQQYEAWNVTGPDGVLVVAMPGGELAIWAVT